VASAAATPALSPGRRCALTAARDADSARRFEAMVMPHLGAGYNLARWLTRNEHDAQDVVQEAYLRALRAFDGYRGGDVRAWMLTIVRNTCFTWLQRRGALPAASADDAAEVPDHPEAGPEAQVLRRADAQVLRGALQDLPLEFREALVLREIEGLSYKEIAEVAGVPLGTVMSRLSRGRKQLQHLVLQRMGGPTR
jgi:RNA polymerase sigma-70 factor (ECF subfamily)